jgi:hypothetical protein
MRRGERCANQRESGEIVNAREVNINSRVVFVKGKWKKYPHFTAFLRDANCLLL